MSDGHTDPSPELVDAVEEFLAGIPGAAETVEPSGLRNIVDCDDTEEIAAALDEIQRRLNGTGPDG